MESPLGQEFETIDKARDTIKDSVGFSYKKIRFNQTRYILISTCISFLFYH